MDCRGPPSFQDPTLCQTHYNSAASVNITSMVCTFMPEIGLNCVKLMSASVNITYMVCIVMYCHGPCHGPHSLKKLDSNCAKLLMTFCQHAWCVLLCTVIDYLHFLDLTLTCQTHHDSAVSVNIHVLLSTAMDHLHSKDRTFTVSNSFWQYQHNVHDVYCCVLPWTTLIPNTGL